MKRCDEQRNEREWNNEEWNGMMKQRNEREWNNEEWKGVVKQKEWEEVWKGMSFMGVNQYSKYLFSVSIASFVFRTHFCDSLKTL